MAAPVYEDTSSDLPGTESDMVVKPPTGRGQRSGGLNWLTWVVLGLFLVGVGVGGYFLYVNVLKDLLEDGTAKRLRTVANFAFRPPGGWRTDEQLREAMNANLAMKRTGPRAHLAVYFEDYKFRTPSDEELVEVAVKHLKRHFPRMEYIDPLQSDGKGRAGSLGGEPALAMTFQATGQDNVPMKGECHMLARRGYGYWLLTWGPEQDAEEVAELWPGLQEAFKHGDNREGWKPTPRPSLAFDVPGHDLVVRYGKEEWQKQDAPRDYDPTAELVLIGFELSLAEDGRLRRVPYAGRSATVRLLVLPKAADLDAAVTAAKEHITKQIGRTNDMVKVTPVPDRGSGKPIIGREVGTLSGQVHQLEIGLSKNQALFALLAVVNRPAGAVVLYCECPAEKRAYWLAEFKAVVGSLRPK